MDAVAYIGTETACRSEAWNLNFPGATTAKNEVHHVQINFKYIHA